MGIIQRTNGLYGELKVTRQYSHYKYAFHIVMDENDDNDYGLDFESAKVSEKKVKRNLRPMLSLLRIKVLNFFMKTIHFWLKIFLVPIL